MPNTQWIFDKEDYENSLNLCKELIIKELLLNNMISLENSKEFLNNHLIIIKDINKITTFVKKLLNIKFDADRNYQMLIVKTRNLYVNENNPDDKKNKFSIVKNEENKNDNL